MKTETIITVIVVMLILSVGIQVAKYQTKDTYETTVTDKQVIVSGNGKGVKSTYLVFTDKGVFKNVDAFWIFKWNSSDVQGSLVVGRKYKIQVYGWRIPFFSMYQNIEEVTELK